MQYFSANSLFFSLYFYFIFFISCRLVTLQYCSGFVIPNKLLCLNSFTRLQRKFNFFPWRSLNSFFLLASSLLILVQWFLWASYRVRFVLSFCLFVFPLMGKAEWGCTSCWWLGLYFCFVCCLDEASCTGCYWWLRNDKSSIQVVSFVSVQSDTPKG